MYCKKCGNKMPEGSLFCPKCGDKVFFPEAKQNKAVEEEKGKNGSSKTKKRIVTIVLCICIVGISYWLYISATHYTSPIPQLNAALAKYISDVHDLQLGMKYEEVAQILDNELFEYYSNDSTSIYKYYGTTMVDQQRASYVVLTFDNGILDDVDIVFETKDFFTLTKKINAYYSKRFGNRYSSSGTDGHYDGQHFWLSIFSISDPVEYQQNGFQPNGKRLIHVRFS